MKKILSVLTLIIMVAMLATTSVFATTNDELPQALLDIGSKYGMTSADKVRIERYLSDYPVTDEQANQLVEKANEIAKVMDDAGKTNISDLTSDELSQIKTIANEAASIVDVTLKFSSNTVEIYKDGKRIETITNNDGKLAYTGNNVNVALVVSSIAVVALAAGIIVRKKIANA